MRQRQPDCGGCKDSSCDGRLWRAGDTGCGLWVAELWKQMGKGMSGDTALATIGRGCCVVGKSTTATAQKDPGGGCSNLKT